MATNEELARKIDQLEKEQRSKWRFFFQFLISPLLLLIIGYLLNQSLEEAQQEFQRLELEVKRIETAQDMLTELFSDVPERAFVADRLMSKLVDKALSKEISEIVTRYYSQKLDKQLIDKNMGNAEKIVAAAEAIGGPAAESIKTKLYYVMVASIKPDQRNEAIRRAKILRGKGYASEVHYSASGYYVVTAGRLPLKEAKSLRAKVIANNDGPDDSYLIPGEKFTKRVYPQ